MLRGHSHEMGLSDQLYLNYDKLTQCLWSPFFVNDTLIDKGDKQ